MKKTIALVLALLTVLSLAACGSGGSKPKETAKPDSSQPAQQTEQPEKTPDSSGGNSGKADNANANVAEQEFGITLPENVKIKTPSGEIYKIGDDFMMCISGGYDFYRYNGTCDYNYYYWDNNAFQDGGGTLTLSVFLDCIFKTVSDDCEKIAGDTKVICGKTCQAYEDSFAKYYVDEETGLYFEMWMNGATNAGYAVTEWDTSITEFPTEAPAK